MIGSYCVGELQKLIEESNIDGIKDFFYYSRSTNPKTDLENALNNINYENASQHITSEMLDYFIDMNNDHINVSLYRIFIKDNDYDKIIRLFSSKINLDILGVVINKYASASLSSKKEYIVKKHYC